MQQKLYRKAGLLCMLVTAVGLVIVGCINEPNPTGPQRMTTLVRFVNALPDGNGVDIWADSARIATNLAYKDFTKYLVVPAGNRFMRVTYTGQDTGQAVFRLLVTYRSQTKCTSVFQGYAATKTVFNTVTQERFTYADETSKLVDSADVKLMNMNVGNSNAFLMEGTTQLSPGIPNSYLSSYIRLKTGDHTFRVVDERAAVVISPFSFPLEGHHRYTFIVVGFSPYEILTLTDEPMQ